MAEKRAVFGWSHGSKLVEASLEGGVATVVLIDEALVGEEDTKTELVFGAGVDVVVAPHPLDEGFLFMGSKHRRRCAEGHKEANHCAV